MSKKIIEPLYVYTCYIYPLVKVNLHHPPSPLHFQILQRKKQTKQQTPILHIPNDMAQTELKRPVSALPTAHLYLFISRVYYSAFSLVIKAI